MTLQELSRRLIKNLQALAPRSIEDVIKIILGILVFIGLLSVVCFFLGRSNEDFEDDIEPKKQEYDDALEKRIAESKEIPRFDAELLLDVNRPYQSDQPDFLGWWGDVIMGKTNPNIYHRKDAKSWIWPY